MAGSILGTRVLRTEDPELLLGSVRYVDDLAAPGAWHGMTVRSTIAHGTFDGLDLDPGFDTSADSRSQPLARQSFLSVGGRGDERPVDIERDELHRHRQHTTRSIPVRSLRVHGLTP